NGLSVVSVNGTRYAILLVSDLDSAELAQLSRTVSAPLARRLEVSLVPDGGTPAALISDRPVQQLAMASDTRRSLTNSRAIVIGDRLADSLRGFGPNEFLR